MLMETRDYDGTIVFHKARTKNVADIWTRKRSELIIQITPQKTPNTTYNYHVSRQSFIKFVTTHYLKEICKEAGITKEELDALICAKKI